MEPRKLICQPISKDKACREPSVFLFGHSSLKPNKSKAENKATTEKRTPKTAKVKILQMQAAGIIKKA